MNRYKNNKNGLVRDLNPGPLAPKAKIIPLDQRAIYIYIRFYIRILYIRIHILMIFYITIYLYVKFMRYKLYLLII